MSKKTVKRIKRIISTINNLFVEILPYIILVLDVLLLIFGADIYIVLCLLTIFITIRAD